MSRVLKAEPRKLPEENFDDIRQLPRTELHKGLTPSTPITRSTSTRPNLGSNFGQPQHSNSFNYRTGEASGSSSDCGMALPSYLFPLCGSPTSPQHSHPLTTDYSAPSPSENMSRLNINDTVNSYSSSGSAVSWDSTRSDQTPVIKRDPHLPQPFWKKTFEGDSQPVQPDGLGALQMKSLTSVMEHDSPPVTPSSARKEELKDSHERLHKKPLANHKPANDCLASSAMSTDSPFPRALALRHVSRPNRSSILPGNRNVFHSGEVADSCSVTSAGQLSKKQRLKNFLNKVIPGETRSYSPNPGE